MNRILLIVLAWGVLAAGAVGLRLWPDVLHPWPRIEPLAHQNYFEVVTCKDRDLPEVKFEMIAIPGGIFQMGSPEDEPRRSADEGPVHLVQVRPFWMGRCEVTWDEYDLYLREAGTSCPDENERRLKANRQAITGPTPSYVDPDYGHGHQGHPALCMTHHAACEYCRWLSKKTGKTYRLPTEAEWEWACRAGTTTAYFFGNDPAPLRDYGWFIENSSPNRLEDDPQTHKVATRKPNPWGLCDMYGNVWEWCLDHYEKDYGRWPCGRLSLSPVIVPTEQRFSHVVRGGSWADEASRCRSAARRGSDKSWQKHDPCRPQSIWWLTQMDVIGFRVVRPVEEQEELKRFRSKVTRASD
jgi:formylglycine-generating enzyme required for sulfatase activity